MGQTSSKSPEEEKVPPCEKFDRGIRVYVSNDNLKGYLPVGATMQDPSSNTTIPPHISRLTKSRDWCSQAAAVLTALAFNEMDDINIQIFLFDILHRSLTQDFTIEEQSKAWTQEFHEKPVYTFDIAQQSSSSTELNPDIPIVIEKVENNVIYIAWGVKDKDEAVAKLKSTIIEHPTIFIKLKVNNFDFQAELPSVDPNISWTESINKWKKEEALKTTKTTEKNVFKQIAGLAVVASLATGGSILLHKRWKAAQRNSDKELQSLRAETRAIGIRTRSEIENSKRTKYASIQEEGKALMRILNNIIDDIDGVVDIVDTKTKGVHERQALLNSVISESEAKERDLTSISSSSS